MENSGKSTIKGPIKLLSLDRCIRNLNRTSIIRTIGCRRYLSDCRWSRNVSDPVLDLYIITSIRPPIMIQCQFLETRTFVNDYQSIAIEFLQIIVVKCYNFDKKIGLENVSLESLQWRCSQGRASCFKNSSLEKVLACRYAMWSFVTLTTNKFWNASCPIFSIRLKSI